MVYRKIIQDNFKIDVNHFQGIPALAYNLMLNISKVELELISGSEMNDIFPSSISETKEVNTAGLVNYLYEYIETNLLTDYAEYKTNLKSIYQLIS